MTDDHLIIKCHWVCHICSLFWADIRFCLFKELVKVPESKLRQKRQKNKPFSIDYFEFVCLDEEAFDEPTGNIPSVYWLGFGTQEFVNKTTSGLARYLHSS